MMRLNQKVRYGLECLFELATSPTEYVDAERVATARKVPTAYAQKILQALSQAGILYAQKGSGYRIARALADISALEVIRALEGTAQPDGAHPLERRIDAALASVSLETLARPA